LGFVLFVAVFLLVGAEQSGEEGVIAFLHSSVLDELPDPIGFEDLAVFGFAVDRDLAPREP
jgi:hypothetical protein